MKRLKKTIKIKGLIVALALIVSYISWPVNVYSQTATYNLTESFSDTLVNEDWIEESYYGIEVLRLERWILKNTQKFSDPILLREIARLKKEAENFAETNDFQMANLWLETIWELLQPDDDAVFLPPEDDSYFLNGLSEVSLKPANKFNWSRELSTGVDVWHWRQEINLGTIPTDAASLASASLDSTILESNGNPFTGVRFKFDYGTGFRNSIQSMVFLKYSRDYVSGELNAKIDKPIGNRSSWRFENRFQGTSYFRSFGINKFWQNTSLLLFRIQATRLFSFDLGDEFILRRYDHKNENNNEDESYPDYFNNTFRAAARLNFGFGSFLQAGYRNVQRKYSVSKKKDYRENRISLSLLQAASRSFSLNLENDLRLRDYTNPQPDSLSIYNDFWENNLTGDMRLDFTRRVGAEVRGTLTKRDYKIVSESLPDYLFWEVEPMFIFKINQEWRIGFGVYYALQNHQKFYSFADYYKVGPVITLELFQINGVLLSLRESFTLERFPNIQTNSAGNSDPNTSSLINFYSDRNSNSLSLFLTWNVSSRWQLNILANLDDDRHKDDSGDSQNTLVGLDLSYSF